MLGTWNSDPGSLHSGSRPYKPASCIRRRPYVKDDMRLLSPQSVSSGQDGFINMRFKVHGCTVSILALLDEITREGGTNFHREMTASKRCTNQSQKKKDSCPNFT